MVPAILHSLPPFPADGAYHVERRKIGSSYVVRQPFGFTPATQRPYDISQSIPPSMLRNWSNNGRGGRRASSDASFVNMVLSSGPRTMIDGSSVVVRDTTEDVALRWLYHLPEGYAKGGKWPLVVYLHGIDERGFDLNQLRQRGPFARTGSSLPFIVVAPQSKGSWETEDLRILVRHAMSRYRVDPKKVFVAGSGVGGTAAWRLADAEPRRFKAIVAPGITPAPQDIRRLRNLRRYEGTEPDPWLENGVIEFLSK